MRSSHMMICVALLVAGVALVASGVGGVVAFLPLVLCMVMMGGMMWLMMRPRGQ